MILGGPPPGGAYGAGPNTAAVAWNPAKAGVAGSQGSNFAMAMPRDMGGLGGIVLPLLVVAVILWFLAERHENLRAGESATLGLKV